MINITICDDEKDFLPVIRQICESDELSYVEKSITEYCSSLSLYNSIKNDSVKSDIYILDIEMPDVSGIDLKQLIKNEIPDAYIIFLTSHPEMMPEAFGRNVLAFVDKDDIEKLLRVLKENIDEIVNDDIIEVRGNKGKTGTRKKDILYILASGHLSEVYTIRGIDENGEYISDYELYDESLIEFLKVLDASFYHLNRKTIINLRNVDNMSEKIVMKDGKEFSFPHGRKKVIISAYHNYCKEYARVY